MRPQTGYSIVYVVVDQPPSHGYRKLLFNTSKHGKYYWGTGNNSYSFEYLQKQVSEGKIFKLPIPKVLEEGMSIWINSIGGLFYGDLINPLKSDAEMCFLGCKLNL